MTDKLIQKIEGSYPFLSICRYADNEYIGIIMNQDKNIITMYDYGMILNEELKRKFLELGEIWWWESNRNIPINIFLKQDWGIFKPCMRSFISKNATILCGPGPSINDLAATTKKRKSIILVKRID